MTDTKEFMQWLAEHEPRLRARGDSTDDIAALAIASGNNDMVVAQWKTQMRFKGGI